MKMQSEIGGGSKTLLWRVLSFFLAAWGLCLPGVHAKSHDSTDERIEIKFAVREKDIDGVKALLGLEKPNSKEVICFYETQNRDLNSNDLILRARYVKEKKGKDADDDDKDNGTTVKLRHKGALDREKVKEIIEAIDNKQEDGKLEKDMVIGKDVSESLSLNHPGSQADLKKVEDMPKTVQGILDALQIKLLQMASFKWSDLKRVGPIHSQVWKHIQIGDLGDDFTAEEWKLSREGQDDRHLLEISIKISGNKADADALGAKLVDFMTRKGFPQDTSAATKTATVLDYYLGKP